MNLRRDADRIIQSAIASAMPGEAVRKAVQTMPQPGGKLVLVAAGKAAWEMARAAADCLPGSIHSGIVITKYGHAKGDIPGIAVREAGHPVPDENSYSATREAVSLVQDLSRDDLVLFLLSGGGSALFEDPLLPAGEMADVTKQLLASGADIVEMNTVRKRLSRVKGGRFGELCVPAQVFTVVLSDIIGDPLDMIASGPAYPDSSTCEDALRIAEKYSLNLSEAARELLRIETPKSLSNVTTHVTGSVKQLALSAEETARQLGYEPLTLTASLACEAREAGAFLAAIAREHAASGRNLAFFAGGETVVHLTGNGLGGRNQEIALSAAAGIRGLDNACVFSFGSDGTDGPTDAAGGYADGDTALRLEENGLSIPAVLADNDAWHALKAVDGLIITGPTGTNVNDLSAVLIRATD